MTAHSKPLSYHLTRTSDGRFDIPTGIHIYSEGEIGPEETERATTLEAMLVFDGEASWLTIREINKEDFIVSINLAIGGHVGAAALFQAMADASRELILTNE